MAAPQPQGRQEPPHIRRCGASGLTRETQHTSHTREGTMLCSLHCAASHRELQPAVPAQASANAHLPHPVNKPVILRLQQS